MISAADDDDIDARLFFITLRYFSRQGAAHHIRPQAAAPRGIML